VPQFAGWRSHAKLEVVNTSQLLSILDAAQINPRSYGVLRSGNDDGLYLLKAEPFWQVFFSERGIRHDTRSYDSEDEACVAFLQWILELRVAGRTARPAPLQSDTDRP
jgi:hypothetical protein